MSGSSARDVRLQGRRDRERVRRARRRRGHLRLAALLGVVATVALIVAEATGGGRSKPPHPTIGRVLVTAHAVTAGTLDAAVADSAVAAARGSLYLLGGIDSAGRSTASIVRLAGTGRGSAAVVGRLPVVQHDAQALALGGEIYVFGGGDVASYAHIVRYDPASGAVTSAGDLPRPQSDVGVAAIGSTAYVVGGYTGSAALDTIVAWRPGTRAHTVARLPYALRYAAVAAVGRRLLIAGGTESDAAVSDGIWLYDPASGSVSQVGVLPVALTHASAVYDDGRVFVIGGRHSASGAQSAGIVAIDPATMQASIVAELPHALSDAAVAQSGRRIVVAGGDSVAGAAQRAILTVAPSVRSVAVRAPRRAALARREMKALDSLGYGRALAGHPSSTAPYEAAQAKLGLPGYLLIADRGNNRILVVDPQGRIHWLFPDAADVAAGRILHFNDDTFVQPGGKALIANEEDYGLVVSVNIKSRAITRLFGVPGVLGGGATELNYPDDAYAFADGSWTVADAYNCRILFVKDRRIIRQYGRSGVCAHDPPTTFGAVNGDTPTPYGGVLVSEIPGHWIDAINANGTLRFAVQPPIAYPSDPQPLPGDRVLLADYSNPGHVLIIDRRGRVLWEYGPSSGEAALNHPSLALQLPNGDIAVNDDYRDRVVIIDPRSNRIVWEYGHLDSGGTAPGYLHTPDGMDFIPAAANGSIDWAATVHP
ncbi:MAG TPA: hypothetical protein VHX66_17975 [Solirubrobacteraceae bacterium]|jgi:hypothetical protein|nr:hypothetical protein [Solirubrobacteraceae bacterium]